MVKYNPLLSGAPSGSPSGTPSGKGLYLTVYPSSRPSGTLADESTEATGATLLKLLY